MTERAPTQPPRPTRSRSKALGAGLLALAAFCVLYGVGSQQRVAAPFQLEADVESLELTVGGSSARTLFARPLAVDAIELAGVEHYEAGVAGVRPGGPIGTASARPPAASTVSRGFAAPVERMRLRATDAFASLRLWQARPGAGGVGVLEPPWVMPETRVHLAVDRGRLALRMVPSPEVRVLLAVPAALTAHGIEVDGPGVGWAAADAGRGALELELLPAPSAAASRVSGDDLSLRLTPSSANGALLGPSFGGAGALPVTRMVLPTPGAGSSLRLTSPARGFAARKMTETLHLEGLRDTQVVALRLEPSGRLALEVEGIAERLETVLEGAATDLRPTATERWLPPSRVALLGGFGLLLAAARLIERRLRRRVVA
ncbi:MAG: hypothetical protein AAGC60_08840 [Acidobacteriota bacterium]